MSRFLIEIGTTGIFNLKPSFASLLTPRTIYTCQSVRKLSEIIASGVDPYLEYYQPAGVSASNYDTDRADDVTILSLVSSTGQWVYVPDSYVLSYPETNGVTYIAVMLGISLGALPANRDLSALKTIITNIVRDTIGVDSVVQEIAVSAPSIVPYADSLIIEAARTTLISIVKSDRALLNKANIDLATAQAKVLALENYIKANLPP